MIGKTECERLPCTYIKEQTRVLCECNSSCMLADGCYILACDWYNLSPGGSPLGGSSTTLLVQCGCTITEVWLLLMGVN